MTTAASDSRHNNFDLLRLFAASQVVWDHSTAYFQVFTPALLATILRAIPGVPVFFVVSGFLISTSYERCRRTGTTQQYFVNRFLRIYPALWTAFGVGVATVLTFGSPAFYHATAAELAKWSLAQLTFVQFDNPDFLRHYGVGVLNGSLWTIPVELSFYVLLPLVYAFLKLRETPGSGNPALFALLAFFAAVNVFFVHLGDAYNKALWYKLFKVTLAPYLYMFLLGVVIQRNLDVLRSVIEGKALLWIALYAGACLLAAHAGWEVGSNTPPVPLMILMGGTIVSCAFSCRLLTERLLRGHDFSYGTYVYHMLVINAFVALGFRNAGWSSALPAVMLIYVCAIVSWSCVERPALSLKGRGTNPALAPRPLFSRR